MNLKDIPISVGDKIIIAAGGYDSDHSHEYNEKKLKEAISQTIKMLKIRRNDAKFHQRIEQSLVINTLFSFNHDYSDNSFCKTWLNATTQVIIEYLDSISKSQHLSKMREILINFVYSLAETKILDERFFSWSCGHSNSEMTFFHFYQSRNFLFGQMLPDVNTREILSTFGLRQSIEVKCKRILGFVTTQPNLKISHDVIPNIIAAHESDISFSTQKDLTLKNFYQIYEWTNISIHYMITSPPWIVWKAFDACEFFFDTTNKNLPSGVSSLDGGIQFTIGVLQKMRADLIKNLETIATKQGLKSFDILFDDKIEAVILDKNNKTIPVEQKSLLKQKKTILV